MNQFWPHSFQNFPSLFKFGMSCCVCTTFILALVFHLSWVEPFLSWAWCVVIQEFMGNIYIHLYLDIIYLKYLIVLSSRLMVWGSPELWTTQISLRNAMASVHPSPNLQIRAIALSFDKPCQWKVTFRELPLCYFFAMWIFARFSFSISHTIRNWSDALLWPLSFRCASWEISLATSNNPSMDCSLFQLV